MESLREGTARLREGTARLREETARLREETARLREETARLREETARLRKGTARTREVPVGTRELTAGTHECPLSARPGPRFDHLWPSVVVGSITEPPPGRPRMCTSCRPRLRGQSLCHQRATGTDCRASSAESLS